MDIGSRGPDANFVGQGEFFGGTIDEPAIFTNALSPSDIAVLYAAAVYTIQFTASPTNGVAPLTVQFDCPSVDSGVNAITQWNWNFGDATTGTLQSPAHNYTNDGQFFPSLIVTNSLGLTLSAPGQTVTVVSYSGLVLNGNFESEISPAGRCPATPATLLWTMVS